MLATAMPQAAANSATCAGLSSLRRASLPRGSTGEERLWLSVIELIDACQVTAARSCASVSIAWELVRRAFRRHFRGPPRLLQLTCPAGRPVSVTGETKAEGCDIESPTSPGTVGPACACQHWQRGAQNFRGQTNVKYCDLRGR